MTAFVMNGGIYMASNVSDSGRVWNCRIVNDPESGESVVGQHGDIEHLRHLLPQQLGKLKGGGEGGQSPAE